jgi:hypothetical protein
MQGREGIQSPEMGYFDRCRFVLEGKTLSPQREIFTNTLWVDHLTT